MLQMDRVNVPISDPSSFATTPSTRKSVKKNTFSCIKIEATSVVQHLALFQFPVSDRKHLVSFRMKNALLFHKIAVFELILCLNNIRVTESVLFLFLLYI